MSYLHHERGSKCSDTGTTVCKISAVQAGSLILLLRTWATPCMTRTSLLATPPPVLLGIYRPLSAAHPYAYGALVAPACTYPKVTPVLPCPIEALTVAPSIGFIS